MLSAANWGGQGLHPRGNFEGFVRAASKDKWLEAHGIEHWTHFYTDYGRELQLRFFDYFLHGKKTAGTSSRKVLLQVRHPGEKFVERARRRVAARAHAMDEVLSRSGRHDIVDASRRPVRPGSTFDAMGDGLTFLTPPLEADTEITGPSALKLFVSSSTKDADIFVVLRVFSPAT